MHKSHNDLWWDLSERDLVWTMTWGTVHHWSQPSYCNAKWHAHSDSAQHLTWPYVSLSRNWAQPVASALQHYICKHVFVCLFLYVQEQNIKIYSMSLTSMIIISIRVPGFLMVVLLGPIDDWQLAYSWIGGMVLFGVRTPCSSMLHAP